MVLKVIGSSSKGNCYILDNGSEALIVEAGVRFAEIKKALEFRVSKVAGCIVTHQHNDHSRSIADVACCGIPTLALPEVWEAKQVTGSRCLAIRPGRGYRFGGFKVLPFPACHDVPCVGYLIDHAETGRIMFLTDSFMCEYDFPGLSHVMIECNYSDEALARAICEGRTLPSQRERLMTSHMELHTCGDFLQSLDLGGVANVVLLHLSNDNSDEERFVRYIQGVTGKCVYVANPGLVIDMARV